MTLNVSGSTPRFVQPTSATSFFRESRGNPSSVHRRHVTYVVQYDCKVATSRGPVAAGPLTAAVPPIYPRQ
jgi:hypothetical protein